MDPAVDRAANPESNGANVPDGAPLESVHAKDAAPAPSSPPSPPLSTPGNPQPLQQSKPQINRPDPTRGVPSAPAAGAPPEANPYIDRSPAVNSAASKSTMDTVKSVLKRWGKKVGETAKKAEDLSRNTWQHLNTGPSLVDATMGRIAQGTKVIAEGGYEKIFRQTFDNLPEEQLKKSYACYLSTSAGPVMGVLYLSSTKLAFCSDNPLSYKVADQTEWSYYKVVIPLNQLKAANPSISKMKSAEKYIQVVSTDNHEFWFMGFMNYDNAVKSLQEALRDIQDSQP